MEWLRSCALLVELPCPFPLEVDRVHQIHQHTRRYRIFDNLFDQAVRLLVHPRVDRLGCRRRGEVEPFHLRIEVGAVRVDERLLDGETLAVPDRIRDLKLHLPVEAAE